MNKLSNSEFLKKASEMIAGTKGSSSVYLSQKRFSYSPSDVPEFSVEPTAPAAVSESKDEKSYDVLIRLTDGNKDKKLKKKISTVVLSEDLDSFWSEYSNVLKNGFIGLKKKDKKKKKKQSKK